MAYTSHLIPVESLRLLVFDLDGTLIDSRQDLVNSVNATLDHLGRPHLPEEIVASYVGDGAGMLVRRALGEPIDESVFESALTFFLDYYREHKLDYTKLYPGVIESLDALRLDAEGKPRKMAVLTNKPENPSRAICEALGLSPYFFQIYGGNSFATKKPDPEGLNALIREAGADPFETVLIGDSEIDVRTARSAGAWALGCRFGFAPQKLEAAEPDCLVDTAADWAEALGAVKVA
jgi:phosphoglycolate phosphatase